MTTILVIIYAVVVLSAYKFGKIESEHEMDRLQADNIRLTGEVWKLTTELNDIETLEDIKWE